MKKGAKNTKFSIFRRRIADETNKAQLVREATRFTLDQYSKTFKDLALYDRTEKAAR